MINHRKIRALRHVYRFNFHHVNSRQNVAEHSFYVAVYAREFAKVIYKNDTIMIDWVTNRALEHDFEEAIIGDIPFLVRAQIKNSELEHLHKLAMIEIGLSDYDIIETAKEIIDFADAYELKIYLEEERKSGNVGLYQIERETYMRLIKSPLYDKLSKVIVIKPIPPKRMTEFMSHEGE